jgi:hypothetical protein
MMTFPHKILICIAAIGLSRYAEAQVSVISDLSHDREVQAGETYDGTIALLNSSTEPAEAKIYQTDYLFFNDGRNIYGDPGSTERSNAGWITYHPPRVVLPPRSTVTIEYRVSVPLNSSSTQLNGSYWSMLMVEEIGKGSPESSLAEPKENQMGVTQVIRYGIQIATHITGTGSREVKFLETKLMKQNSGDHYLQVDIENSGDLWMRPEVYVDLFDGSGIPRGRHPGSAFRMYPGTSVRQRLALPDLPAGEYKALVVVDAGGDDAFGAQYTIRF